MFDLSPDIAKNISRVAVAFVPMLLGMVLHELSHGYAAYKLGDPTAKLQGRLTLNPIVHLDVTGSILFIVTALFSPIIFGWAKPVQVQPRYFKNPRQGMMLISFAGPAANFLLALAFGALYAVLLSQLLSGAMTLTPTTEFFLRSARMGIWINIVLGWFNLLPLPALDGGHILAGLLPEGLARKFYSLSRYGMIILVVLLASGVLRYVLVPLADISLDLVGAVFSIPPRFL